MTTARDQRHERISISILGRFELRAGDQVLPIAPEAQHLLALLALRDSPVSRAVVAGTLWPDTSEEHALRSQRTALSRLNVLGHPAVVATPTDLALAPEVATDLRDARALVRRLTEADATPDAADLTADAIETLSADCLPGWNQEWATVETEQWRNLRLHALDSLAGRLTDAGRYDDAVAAALTAQQAAPLRESACAALSQAHLAGGNTAEAVRVFDAYRTLLARELQIEPTTALAALVANLPST